MSATTPNFRDDMAADAARLLLRLGVAILALGLPVIALMSRRAGFILFPISGALILLAAMLRASPDAPRRLVGAFGSRLGAAALFLVCWAALSLIWTPFRAEAMDHVLRIVATGLFAAAAAAALPRHTRSSDLYLLPIGAAAGAALAIMLAFSAAPVAPADMETHALPRGIAALSVLVWPALGALGARQHWAFAVALFLAVAAAAALNFAPISLTALGCGALAFAAARGDLTHVSRGLGGLAALLLIGAPLLLVLGDALIAARGGEPSEFARSVAESAAIIKTDPARLLTGHGFDAAVRSVQAGFLPAATPRSLLFEIWYDLGALGALGLSAVFYLCFAAAGRSGAAAGPALAGGLTTCLVFALAGLHTTQVWWITLLASGLVATTLVVRGQYRTSRPLARIVEAGAAE